MLPLRIYVKSERVKSAWGSGRTNTTEKFLRWRRKSRRTSCGREKHGLKRVLTIDSYLKRGANISAISESGFLAHITAKGHIEVLRVLLDAGANVNFAEPETDVTALMQAAHNGHIEILRLLLERGASVGATPEQQYHTVSWAIANDNVEVFEILLAQGIDPNIQSEDGGTLLMRAARCGSINVMREMIAKGANVNASSKDKQTALRCARRFGRTEAERILKEAGAQEHQLSFAERLRDRVFVSLLRRIHR